MYHYYGVFLAEGVEQIGQYFKGTYNSLLRPILEYACDVLDGSAIQTGESLESVQNTCITCIRIATGALRTSPILPLQVETKVRPPCLRRWELAIRYASRVLSVPNQPCRCLQWTEPYSPPTCGNRLSQENRWLSYAREISTDFKEITTE